MSGEMQNQTTQMSEDAASAEWQAAVSAIESEDNGVEPPNPTERIPSGSEKNFAEGEASDNVDNESDASEGTEEKDGVASDNASDKSPATAELSSKLSEYEDRIKQLEARLAAEKTESEKKPKELELNEEAKFLLENTPGLKDLVEALTKSRLDEALGEKTKEEQQKQLLEKQKSEESRLEQSYQKRLTSKFSKEFPDLKLDEIRNSPDYKDWLGIRKSWKDSVLAKADYYDETGELTVLQRFIRENYGDRTAAEQGREADNKRRLAATRQPGGSPTRGTRTDTDPWRDAVRNIEKESNGRSRFV